MQLRSSVLESLQAMRLKIDREGESRHTVPMIRCKRAEDWQKGAIADMSSILCKRDQMRNNNIATLTRLRKLI
jgi:hypothetical protein